MKRNLLKRVLAPVLCIIMVACLSACGSKSNSIRSSKEPVPASKAFGAEGVWYEGIPSDKTNSVKSILYFNGSGQVTRYQTSSYEIGSYLSFADLDKKNNEEIITLAKERDKALFEQGKSEVVDAFQEEINDLNKEKDQLQSEYDSQNYDLASDYVFNSQSDIPKWYEKRIRIHKLGIDFYNLLIEKVNAIEYKEPKPVDFTLSAKSDNTGNSISKEQIDFDRNFYFRFISIGSAYSFHTDSSPDPFRDISSVDQLVENYKAEYKEAHNNNREFDWDAIAYSKPDLPQAFVVLEPDDGPQNIYDMVFRGYTTLTTMVDQNHAGFTLDQIDAKGVEIDKK